MMRRHANEMQKGGGREFVNHLFVVLLKSNAFNNYASKVHAKPRNREEGGHGAGSQ